MHAQTVVLLVIWDGITLMWRHCNVSYVSLHDVRVKCCSPCLNFSCTWVPAMKSKQKMNQYSRVAKSTSILCHIDEKYIIILLIRTSAASQIHFKVWCINIHAPFFIIFISIEYVGISCNIFSNSPDNLVLKCIPTDIRDNLITAHAVFVIYNVCTNFLI